jgi:hypothetical protein
MCTKCEKNDVSTKRHKANRGDQEPRPEEAEQRQGKRESRNLRNKTENKTEQKRRTMYVSVVPSEQLKQITRDSNAKSKSAHGNTCYGLPRDR